MLNTPVASNVGDGTKDNLPASNNYISSSGTGTDTTAATSPTSQKGADTDLTTEAIGQGTTPNTDGDSDSSTQPSNERQGTALKAQDVSTISTGTGSDTATNKNVNGGDSALQKPGTQVSALPFSDESATEIVSDTTNGNTPVNSNDGAMDFTKTSKKKLRRSPRDFGNSGPA